MGTFAIRRCGRRRGARAHRRSRLVASTCETGRNLDRPAAVAVLDGFGRARASAERWWGILLGVCDSVTKFISTTEVAPRELMRAVASQIRPLSSRGFRARSSAGLRGISGMQEDWGERAPGREILGRERGAHALGVETWLRLHHFGAARVREGALRPRRARELGLRC
jgi:hypothetical protein